MPQHPAKEGVRVQGGENLFETKKSAALCHTTQFSYTPPPVDDMMDDAKVDDCVKTRVREGEILSVSHKKLEPLCQSTRPIADGLSDKTLFEIKRDNSFVAHHPSDHLRPASRAAAYFEGEMNLPPAA
jgi:hypothetical protein